MSFPLGVSDQQPAGQDVQQIVDLGGHVDQQQERAALLWATGAMLGSSLMGLTRSATALRHPTHRNPPVASALRRGVHRPVRVESGLYRE
jgi:hypothetical protein